MVTFNGDVGTIPGKISYAAQGVCLSGDNKPTNVGNGSILLEIDTGKIFIFDKENETWMEWSGSNG